MELPEPVTKPCRALVTPHTNSERCDFSKPVLPPLFSLAELRSLHTLGLFLF